MRQEVPMPVAVAVIAVLVIAIVVLGYFYFTRKEVYTPGTGGSAGGQVQELRPVVPGQPPDAAPQQGQGGSAAPAQPF